MKSVRTILVFALVTLVTFVAASTAEAGQQQHLVTPTQLAATVADSAVKQDTNRAVVREALQRPEVQAIAAQLGLDIERAASTVEAMSGANLDEAAHAAAQVNDHLAGGASTVVISTTTIIIILLLVIVLIVALK